MAAQQENQITGRRVDEPVTVVGKSGKAHDQQHERVYKPDDTQFHFYEKLLGGLFENLTKWQGIFAQYAQPSHNFGFGITSYSPIFKTGLDSLPYEEDKNSRFYVVETPRGLEQVPEPPPHSVLRASMETGHEKTGMVKGRATRMSFYADKDDKQLPVDFEGAKPDGVEVVICDMPNILKKKYLEITAIMPYGESTDIPRQNVRYELAPEGIKIVRGYERCFVDYLPMSDEYATLLLNAIDRLIQTSTSPTPQNERATQEILLALPHQTRRTAGQ